MLTQENQRKISYTIERNVIRSLLVWVGLRKKKEEGLWTAGRGGVEVVF